MKCLLFIAVLVLCASIANADESQTPSFCTLCKSLMTYVRNQISGRVPEPSVVTRVVKGACESFFINDLCNQYLYPYMDEVFRSLRDNRTDSIACNRVNMCKTKITRVTGNIIFAQGDVLSEIRPVGDNQIQKVDLWRISHPSIPQMAITGFSCSPDYCAVILKGNLGGTMRYASTALSTTNQIHNLLPDVGTPYYGPWYDANTDEFWVAYGTPQNFTFGIFDPSDGKFYKRISTRLYIPQANAPILSGSVLDRYLYFTVLGDYRVYILDLSLHIFAGNITLSPSSPNIMLNHNPVTQIMYGYSPGPDGVFRFDSLQQRTKIASIDFTGIGLVPSSTIDPTQNTMWISLWGIPSRAWMKIDLTKTNDNVRWTPVGTVEGFFDFNPFTIDRVDE